MFILDGPLRLSDDGVCVLKPVQIPPKGEREVSFYERVFQDDEDQEDILELRRFLPHYYGVVEFSILNNAIILLMLLPLVNLLSHPHIVIMQSSLPPPQCHNAILTLSPYSPKI